VQTKEVSCEAHECASKLPPPPLLFHTHIYPTGKKTKHKIQQGRDGGMANGKKTTMPRFLKLKK